MSRVAKAPVTLPNNVTYSAGNEAMIVKGPKGTLTMHVNKLVDIYTNENDTSIVNFKPKDVNNSDAWKHAGTAKSNFANMVEGVTKGFVVKLELVGVGYRAQNEANKIILSLGFSHPINYQLPEGVTAVIPNNTTIELHGVDKQLVGQVASEIRSYRPPEPYKGKGVKYAGEIIARKEAKKK